MGVSVFFSLFVFFNYIILFFILIYGDIYKSLNNKLTLYYFCTEIIFELYFCNEIKNFHVLFQQRYVEVSAIILQRSIFYISLISS